MKKLSSWLRRPPVPVKLRVTTYDDSVKTVLVPATGGRRFADTAENVQALDPVKIEALDEKDNVIRVTDVESDRPAVAEAEAEGDDQITKLARLISAAHDAGAERHANAYALAFEKMYGLVTILADRLTSVEKAWQTTLARQAAAATAASSPEEDKPGSAIENLLATVIASGGMGAMAKPSPAPAPAPAPVANGKKG